MPWRCPHCLFLDDHSVFDCQKILQDVKEKNEHYELLSPEDQKNAVEEKKQHSEHIYELRAKLLESCNKTTTQITECFSCHFPFVASK
jgi:DNA-binding transcriptional regulator GbsR (MarR family)